MPWTIKPLLGIGQIKLISAFDEAIDWERSSCTIDEFLKDPVANLEKLVAQDGRVMAIFRCRAPTEIDLMECDSTTVKVDDKGGRTLEQHARRENVHLARRCIEAIENESIEVKFSMAPDGRQWISDETAKQIPYIVLAEIGVSLRESQTLKDDLKNVSGPPAGPITGEK